MALSTREGRRIAERAAWAKTGERRRFWYTYGRRSTPYAVGLALAGIVIYGIVLAYQAVTEMFTGPEAAPSAPAGGMPGGVLIAAGLLALATAAGMRVATRATRFGVVVAISLALVIGWLGIIAFGIGTLG